MLVSEVTSVLSVLMMFGQLFPMQVTAPVLLGENAEEIIMRFGALNILWKRD